MSKQDNNLTPNEYHEDEIDIFEILKVLIDKWKILAGFAVLGLIIGIIVSLNIAKQYTAEGKIKLFKLTLNQLVQDKDTKFHVLKLEDKVFVDSFKEKFKEKQGWSEAELKETPLGLKPSDDPKKAPGIVSISATSIDNEIPIAYIDMVNAEYADLLQNDLKNVRNIKIKELEARQAEYFQKLKDFEKTFKNIDSEKILEYECNDRLKSDDELEKAFEKYKDIVKQRELLENIIPKLKNASPAEICDAFKTTCSNLPENENISDDKTVGNPNNKKESPLVVNMFSNNESQVIVSYREKENKVEFLKGALQQAAEQEKTTLLNKLNEAKIDLQAFAKVIFNQLVARKNLLIKQEQALLKKIAGIKKFQQSMQTEFLKYNEIKNRYNSIKKNYLSVTEILTDEKDQPEVKYYCEVINQPEITKTNSTKRLSPIVIIPILLVGIAAFLMVFIKAYKEHNKKF